ncbi:MAG: hypothetical protein M1297_06210 [Nitrospirae bacterium]|nr:hypothetical protein [Nitrospirota bacterium]
MKSRSLIFGPFVLSLFILGTLALSVHYYRETFLPGKNFSPGTPRLQRPFDLRVPLSDLKGVRNGDVVRIEVEKIRNAFFSTAYYSPGSFVLNLPVQVTDCGVCVRMSLWDAGKYRVEITGRKTGKRLQSLSLTVIAPVSLYRNDVFLLVAILVLSFFSGRTVSPVVRSLLPDRLSSAPVHRTLIIALVCLSLGLASLPPREHPPLDQKPSSPVLHESEGRPDPTPAPIVPPAENGGGLLKITHNMDSWTDYGRSLTFFEGPVKDLAVASSFFLLPDDGRYFLTLWTSRKGQIRRISWLLRARPVSPLFPWSLFSGLTLLSFAGFLAGAYQPRSRPDDNPRPGFRIKEAR